MPYPKIFPCPKTYPGSAPALFYNTIPLVYPCSWTNPLDFPYFCLNIENVVHVCNINPCIWLVSIYFYLSFFLSEWLGNSNVNFPLFHFFFHFFTTSLSNMRIVDKFDMNLEKRGKNRGPRNPRLPRQSFPKGALHRARGCHHLWIRGRYYIWCHSLKIVRHSHLDILISFA